MKKAMTVTYVVDGALYVNLTNRCSNRCSFCIRNNGDGAYGSESLWLEREPTEKEVMEAVLSQELSSFRELVFCGYGEPTYRLELAREVALSVKKKYPQMQVRMNTNGQSDLINGGSTAHLFADAFDTVSISLNTPSADLYADMCLPVYGKSAFDSILSFAKDVKNYVHNVLLSVVRETLTEQQLAECADIAESLGVTLKVRTLITGN